MLAAKIATMHHEAKQYELSLRFLKRISKKYREVNHRAVYTQLVQLAAECAEKIGDHDAAIRFLYELLSLVQLPSPTLQKLVDLLHSEKGAQDEKSKPIRITEEDEQELITASVTFLEASVKLDTPITFQLVLHSALPTRDLPFSTAKVYVNDEARPRFIVSDLADNEQEPVTLLGLASNTETKSANASLFRRGAHSLVWQGEIMPNNIGDLAVTMVELETDTPVKLVLALKPKGAAQEGPLSRPQIRLASGQPILLPHRPTPAGLAMVIPLAHQLDVALDMPKMAYLQERVKVPVKISNADLVPLRCELSIETDYLDEISLFAQEQRLVRSEEGTWEIGEIKQNSVYEAAILLFPAHPPGRRNVQLKLVTRESKDDSQVDSEGAVEVSQLLEVGSLLECTVSSSRAIPISRSAIACSVHLDMVFANHRGPIKFTKCDLKHSSDRISSLQCIGIDALLDGAWIGGDRAELLCKAVIAVTESSQPILVQLEVAWASTNGSGAEMQTFEVSVDLQECLPALPPIFTVQHSAGDANASLASSASLEVHNTSSDSAVPVTVNVEAGAHFAASGSRTQTIPALLPGSTRRVDMRFLPMSTGSQLLHRVSAKAMRASLAEDEASEAEEFLLPGLGHGASHYDEFVQPISVVTVTP
jgi:hypothetical protein